MAHRRRDGPAPMRHGRRSRQRACALPLPATVACIPVPLRHTAAPVWAGPPLSDSTYHQSATLASGRTAPLSQSRCEARRARLGGGGSGFPPGRHGPDGRDRVPVVPVAASRRRRRRAPRGAGLPHRRGRAGAARIQPLLLAPAAHGPRVLVPDDRSAADVLPGDLGAPLLLPQSQSAGALGPAAARPRLRTPGAGHHHLQQAPEREGALRDLARADGAADRAVRWRAVRGGRAPALPQAHEELDAGQAQALPCDLGAGGLPAGLCQPDAGHVLPVVHHLSDQRLLVPGHAVSPSHQPGYHEPGEQRLPVPQTEPALRA